MKVEHIFVVVATNGPGLVELLWGPMGMLFVAVRWGWGCQNYGVSQNRGFPTMAPLVSLQLPTTKGTSLRTPFKWVCLLLRARFPEPNPRKLTKHGF